MDEKHRQYCIRLGNPYMREQRYQEQFNKEMSNPSWISELESEANYWTDGNKKNVN